MLSLVFLYYGGAPLGNSQSMILTFFYISVFPQHTAPHTITLKTNAYTIYSWQKQTQGQRRLYSSYVVFK